MFSCYMKVVSVIFLFVSGCLGITYGYTKFYHMDLKDKEIFGAMLSCTTGGALLGAIMISVL